MTTHATHRYLRVVSLLFLSSCTERIYRPCELTNILFYSPELERTASAFLIGQPSYDHIGPSIDTPTDTDPWLSEIWNIEPLQIINAKEPVPAQFKALFKVYNSPLTGHLYGPGSINEGPTMMYIIKHKPLPDPRDVAQYEIVSSAVCN